MINLPIPDHIQAMLVDDWENVTKNNQLVPLPHEKPVTKILDDYLNYERPSRPEASASLDILEEVVAGLREYFDKSLGRILLYRLATLLTLLNFFSCLPRGGLTTNFRFERYQYMDVRKLWDNLSDEDAKYKGVCDVYGAEHLARLIGQHPANPLAPTSHREE